VVLWTAPRCVSTAFERSMMELENCKTFHEPYLQSFYFGAERQSERYKHFDPDEKKTYDAIGEMLEKEYDGIELVFSKDMAYYMCNHFQELIHGRLRQFQHTFLIRSPAKSIRSFYLGSINKVQPGWDYFDPDEGGFKELLELYRFIAAKKDKNPIVVDADDLLEDPEGIMRAYCEGIGVTFDRKMLEWKNRCIPEWNVCGSWHDNVRNSSGFRRKDPNKSKVIGNNNAEEEGLPDIVMQNIEESMPYYQELFKKRIAPEKAREKK